MGLVFVLTAFSPLIQPAEADPVGGGKPPPGGIGGESGGEASAGSYGNPYLPDRVALVRLSNG